VGAGPVYRLPEGSSAEGAVVLDSNAVNAELQKRITTLEDSALYINDLANCIPEHCDWLWAIADKLTAEAAALKQSLDDQPSTGSSKAEGNERQ
jgi:hypothetical protein